MNLDDYDEIADRLERYADVSDEALADVVIHNGLCFWVFDRAAMPELSGAAEVDRALAAHACAGCPVKDECLELELRLAGQYTAGVWGGLSDYDRRGVHAFWTWRRMNPAEENRGEPQ